MLRKHSLTKNQWLFQEAKAKLSQVMDKVQENGMQVIVRRGSEFYVIIPKERYDDLTKSKESLVDFFMNAPCPEVELDLKRSDDTGRDINL